ncbi:MAG: hypothetical protein Q4B09_05755 [Lachnospiraceae bacterium]|nr:hypothetical protein [Lachnospiraceae bacterium]
MKKVPARTMTFFDKEVVNDIIVKYGFDERAAIRDFIQSETYQMLLDPEMEIYKMSPLIVFDMWEAEKISGDPRMSQYIRA